MVSVKNGAHPSIVEFDMGPLTTSKSHQVDDDTKRTIPLCEEEEDYTSVSVSVAPAEAAEAAVGEGEEEEQKEGDNDGNDQDDDDDDEASEISSLCGIEQGFVDDVEASIRSLERSALPPASGTSRDDNHDDNEDVVSNASTAQQHGGGLLLLPEESVSSRYRDYKLRPPTPELPTSLLQLPQQQQEELEGLAPPPLLSSPLLTSPPPSQQTTTTTKKSTTTRRGRGNNATKNKPSFNAFLQQRKKTVFEKNLDYIEGAVLERAGTLERNINYIKNESHGKLLRREFPGLGGGPGTAEEAVITSLHHSGTFTSSNSFHGGVVRVANAGAFATSSIIKEEEDDALLMSASVRSTRSLMDNVKTSAASALATSAATTLSKNIDYIRSGGLLTEIDPDSEELEDCDNLSTELSTFIHDRARIFTRNIGTLLGNVVAGGKPTQTPTKTTKK